MDPQQIKGQVKRAVLQAAYATGLLNLYARRQRHDTAFVLMYHRVLLPAEVRKLAPEPGMYVTPENFERQLKFLKENYQVLPLADLLGRFQCDEDVQGCCAITFDDGWLDNYTHAYPLLRAFNLPATIFLATGYIGTEKMFWPDELSFQLRRLAEDPVLPPLSQQTADFLKSIPIDLHRQTGAAVGWAIRTFKGLDGKVRQRILEDFRGLFGRPEIPRQMLTWQEVDEMAGSGLVSFGAHSVEHELLDQISLAQAKEEISSSCNVLAERLEGVVPIFAYPNGNYNDDILALLEEQGQVAAVTTKKGFWQRSTPLKEIPRIGIHDDVSSTIPLFLGRILLKRF